jgi:hypothetical protein
MAHRSPPRKVTYFESVPPRLAQHHHRAHLRGRAPLPLHDAEQRKRN